MPALRHEFGTGDRMRIVEYVGPVQTLRVPALADHVATVERLLPMCHYGPDYRRAVADELGRYVEWLRKGEREFAEMALARAVHEADRYRPANGTTFGSVKP